MQPPFTHPCWCHSLAQDSEKCFTCDSRDPSLPESHRIENVIYLSSPHDQRTWWQSENGEVRVAVGLPHMHVLWGCLPQPQPSLSLSVTQVWSM